MLASYGRVFDKSDTLAYLCPAMLCFRYALLLSTEEQRGILASEAAMTGRSFTKLRQLSKALRDVDGHLWGGCGWARTARWGWLLAPHDTPSHQSLFCVPSPNPCMALTLGEAYPFLSVQSLRRARAQRPGEGG